MDQTWRDSKAAWWAKLERAKKHIEEIYSTMASFEESGAYAVLREDTDKPNVVAYRFKILRPVPIQLLTTIGDAIHNMRSALDSVAFELARQHLNGVMTDKQEQATQFPICETGTDFDGFLNRSNQRNLYGTHDRNAMRCVQPFAMQEEARTYRVSVQANPQVEFAINELNRIHKLSIVDKHRRLPLLSWYLHFTYWTEPSCSWKFAQRPNSGFEDGDLIGFLTCPDQVPPTAEAKFTFKLTLTDDPASSIGPGFHSDFTDVLSRWHDYLRNWVIPRVFLVAEGNPPPIGISAY